MPLLCILCLNSCKAERATNGKYILNFKIQREKNTCTNEPLIKINKTRRAQVNFIYLFITEMVFGSSQELESVVNYVFLLEKLEASKGNLRYFFHPFYFEQRVIHNFFEGKLGAEGLESVRTNL